MMDPYLLGLTDADLYTPAEHTTGIDGDGAAILTFATATRALRSAGVPLRPGSLRDYLRGFGDHGRFLVAAARVGAVDAVSGEVA